MHTYNFARHNRLSKASFFSELQKINIFFDEKLAEAKRKYATLDTELSSSYETGKKQNRFSLASQQKDIHKIPSRKSQDLKLAYSEYYLGLVLLQNYQNLNYTGFRKILKKHDKNVGTTSGATWRVENLENASFYTNKDIDKLLQDTEATFTNHLESGDRKKAMNRLKVPPLGDKLAKPWTTFKLGFFSGAFIILLGSVVLSGFFSQR